MLLSSRYAVTFPTNGLRFTGEITFQPGVTVVVGKNGTGKTLGTIELWRYLLFGKKALRGPASDYKHMEAEGTFLLKDTEYTVLRKGTKATLSRGDEEIAVGAEAVDKKIVELMGFGLDVFDICNASVQKESNRLSKLTAAKRKELIDEVVGLSRNEEVEKECKQQAKLKKLEAQTIRENVVKPEQPVKPQAYKCSTSIRLELDAARETERERDRLRAQLRDKPTPPIAPRPDTLEIEIHQEKRRNNLIARAGIEADLARIPVAKYTREQVEIAEEVQRRGPRPVENVECPKCNYRFGTEDYVQRMLNWPNELHEHPDLYGSELLTARLALDKADERAELERQLLELPEFDDRSAELAGFAALERQWLAYDAAMDDWKESEKARKALLKLKTYDIAELEKRWVDAQIYESQTEAYEKAQADYQEKTQKAARLAEEAEDFLLGAKRLAEARRELKAHLAPSLSRIASALISDMSCGKLNNVEVNEDMEITVDGQDVSTLSGAGETAANLSLRLALGRTLVAGIFPVFLGDEIDSDADEERSEAVFECLRNLRSQFKQVIIITHKPHVTADHVIDFNK